MYKIQVFENKQLGPGAYWKDLDYPLEKDRFETVEEANTVIGNLIALKGDWRRMIYRVKEAD